MNQTHSDKKTARPRGLRPIFSRRLWLYGLSRIRTVSLVFGVIVLVLSFITTFSTGFSLSDSDMTAILPHTSALLLIPFAASVLTFVQFSFLHSRRASDAILSLPYTRACLLVSLLLSTFTVVAALTLEAGLAAFLKLLIDGKLYLIGALCLRMLFSFLTSLYFSSVMLLLTLLTGRGWVPFLLFGSAVSLPRLCLFILSFAVTGRYVPRVGGFLSYQFSVPIMFFVSNINGKMYFSAASLLWGLLLPLLLFALCVLVFRRRPAETAGSPAVNRPVQFCLRMVFSAPAMLAAALVSDIDSGTILLIVLLVITLGAHLVYEAVSTLNGRRVLRALPAYLLLILLIPAYRGISFISEQTLKHETIRPASVRAVYIDDCTPVQSDCEISDHLLRKYAVTDETVISMTAASVGTGRGEEISRGPEVIIFMKDGRILHRALYVTPATLTKDWKDGERPTRRQLLDAYAAADEMKAMCAELSALPRLPLMTVRIPEETTEGHGFNYEWISAARGTEFYDEMLSMTDDELRARAHGTPLTCSYDLLWPVGFEDSDEPDIILRAENPYTGISWTLRSPKRGLPQTYAGVRRAFDDLEAQYGGPIREWVWR